MPAVVITRPCFFVIVAGGNKIIVLLCCVRDFGNCRDVCAPNLRAGWQLFSVLNHAIIHRLATVSHPRCFKSLSGRGLFALPHSSGLNPRALSNMLPAKRNKIDISVRDTCSLPMHVVAFPCISHQALFEPLLITLVFHYTEVD